MRTLILDHYTRQSLTRRFLGNALTGLGWAFWVYLWLPLIAAIALLLGSHPEQATSAAAHSIVALMLTMISHLSIIGIMIAAFFAWSLLQWLGKPYRRVASHKRQSSLTSAVLRHPQHQPAQKEWRLAQRMIVNHDDRSGRIKQVDVLDLTNHPISYGIKKQACL